MTLYDYMNARPVISLLVTYVIVHGIGSAVIAPFKLAFLAYNRRLRHKSIMAHGWPKAPLDADGDVVVVKKPEAPKVATSSAR